jgi:CRISPR-associated endoribonuclease Cas2 subtype I-E
MLVMVIEKVPAGLRPMLSHWLSEPKEGIFIGNTSEQVVDELWEKTTNAGQTTGAIIQIWIDQTTGNYSYRQCGARNRGRFNVSNSLGITPGTPNRLDGFFILGHQHLFEESIT